MTIDWDHGTWVAAGGRPAAQPWTITIASDWAPMGLYEERLLADPEGVYGDLLPVLRSSKLCIVNVESVLGRSGSAIPKGGPNIRGAEDAVASLACVPFHVACLANNHSMDYGPQGLERTMDVLQHAGLSTVGAGLRGADASEPLVLTVQDTRIGIVNCAEGEECRSTDGGPGVYGIESPLIEDQIRQLQATVDLLLVIFHGGREHTPLPPPYVVHSLRGLAAAGADAVVAHHPHVPQGIEVVHGVPIAYSLGNFVFWEGVAGFYRRAGYLLHLQIAEKKLVGLALTPYVLRPEGLEVMKGALRTRFLTDLEDVSGRILDPVSVRVAWQAFSDQVGVEFMANSLERGIRSVSKGSRRRIAALRNLLQTPAHRELYIELLGRALNGEIGNSPEWATELVDRWLTLPFDMYLARANGDVAGAARPHGSHSPARSSVVRRLLNRFVWHGRH